MTGCMTTQAAANSIRAFVSRTVQQIERTSAASSSNPPRSYFFPNIIVGSRGSGRTTFLDEIHRVIATTDDLGAVVEDTASGSSSRVENVVLGHFHSGGTPSELSKMSHDVERFLLGNSKRKRAEQGEAGTCSVPPTLLVVIATVDDFDVLTSLHQLQRDPARPNDSDDGSSSSTSTGAGRFQQARGGALSHARGADRSAPARDLWACMYDAKMRETTADPASDESAEDSVAVAYVIWAASTTSSSSSSLASSSLWIFPEALQWAVPCVGAEEWNRHVAEPSFERLLELDPEAMRRATASDLAAVSLLLPREETDEEDSLENVSTLLSRCKRVSTANAASMKKRQHLHGATTSTSAALLQEARRKGCAVAFERLRDAIFRFALFAEGAAASASSSSSGLARMSRGRQRPGAVLAALQPPSGVLLTDAVAGADGAAAVGAGGTGDGRADAAAELGVRYAASLGLATHCVEAPLLFGPIFGETEERIRAAFADAYNARPCVLAVHNVDAIAVSRGTTSSSASSGGSGNVLQRAVATFLCEADGVDRPDRASSVFLVATTARRKDIDEAALRPGRLEQHIELCATLQGSSSSGGGAPRAPNLAQDTAEDFVRGWFSSESEPTATPFRVADGALLNVITEKLGGVCFDEATRCVQRLFARCCRSDDVAWSNVSAADVADVLG